MYLGNVRRSPITLISKQTARNTKAGSTILQEADAERMFGAVELLCMIL